MGNSSNKQKNKVIQAGTDKIVLDIKNRTIVIHRSFKMSVHIGDAGIFPHNSHGLKLWEANIIEARFCVLNNALFRNKKVLQLHSGVGIGGIALSKWGKCQSIAMSDHKDEMIQNINRNCEKNEVKNVTSFKLNLTEFKNFKAKYDIIISADLLNIKYANAYTNIYEAFKHFLNPEGKAIIVMGDNKEYYQKFKEIVELDKFQIKYEKLVDQNYYESPLLNKADGSKEFPEIQSQVFFALYLTLKREEVPIENNQISEFASKPQTQSIQTKMQTTQVTKNQQKAVECIEKKNRQNVQQRTQQKAGEKREEKVKEQIQDKTKEKVEENVEERTPEKIKEQIQVEKQQSETASQRKVKRQVEDKAEQKVEQKVKDNDASEKTQEKTQQKKAEQQILNLNNVDQAQVQSELQSQKVKNDNESIRTDRSVIDSAEDERRSVQSKLTVQNKDKEIENIPEEDRVEEEDEDLAQKEQNAEQSAFNRDETKAQSEPNEKQEILATEKQEVNQTQKKKQASQQKLKVEQAEQVKQAQKQSSAKTRQSEQAGQNIEHNENQLAVKNGENTEVVFLKSELKKQTTDAVNLNKTAKNDGKEQKPENKESENEESDNRESENRESDITEEKEEKDGAESEQAPKAGRKSKKKKGRR